MYLNCYFSLTKPTKILKVTLRFPIVSVKSTKITGAKRVGSDPLLLRQNRALSAKNLVNFFPEFAIFTRRQAFIQFQAAYGYAFYVFYGFSD